LIHLAKSLIRSKLVYGQEVYFSAPKTHLRKLQSLDSKAFKLALGIPIHSPTLGAYSLAGVLPLDKVRKLAAASYIVRCQGSPKNSTDPETHIRSDLEFSKRSRNVGKFKTIATFASDLFESCNVPIDDLSIAKDTPLVPPWEIMTPIFDHEYIDIKKSDNPNIVESLAKERLASVYNNHLHVYTDGSKIDGMAGSGFVIPAFKISKSYHLGQFHSIFVAELVAILMSLSFLSSLSINFIQIVLCVDSKSVIQAISSPFRNSIHKNIMYEIRLLVHSLIVRGTQVSFCWIPSHLNIVGNNWADCAARHGALCANSSEKLYIPVSVSDYKSMLKERIKYDFIHSVRFQPNLSLLHGPRNLMSVLFRLQLHSWKTKFVSSVNCICGDKISIDHIFCNCQAMKLYFGNTIPTSDFLCTNTNLRALLLNKLPDYPVCEFMLKIYMSPLGDLL
jgi:ribonuclease HI